jgi:hypothetical protein
MVSTKAAVSRAFQQDSIIGTSETLRRKRSETLVGYQKNDPHKYKGEKKNIITHMIKSED